MDCPNCGGVTRVWDSVAYGTKVYRLRRCVSCGYRFCTTETESDSMYMLHKIKHMKREERLKDV